MSRVCVALTTYNGEAHLQAQLDSLLDQARLPDELVACDDGSTDGTLEMLRAFAKRAPFDVRVHENATNLGLIRNFEQAARLCSGDIIMFCDQDDVWLPNKVELLAGALDENPQAGVSFSDAQVVDEALRPRGFTLWQTASFDAGRQARLRENPTRLLAEWNVVQGAAMAFRSSVRDVAFPVGRGWMHDGWTALMGSLVSDVVPIATPTLLYRQHGRNQLGAALRPELEVRLEKMRTATRSQVETFARDHEYWREAVTRMRSIHALPERREAMDELAQRVEHLAARARLPARRTQRLGPVLSELRTGRYGRFSAGFLSAVKDVALR